MVQDKIIRQWVRDFCKLHGITGNRDLQPGRVADRLVSVIALEYDPCMCSNPDCTLYAPPPALDPGGSYPPVPHFSTDYVAMGLVIEQVLRNRHVMVIKADGLRDGVENPYYTLLGDNKPAVHAHTLPMAVCQAALAIYGLDEILRRKVAIVGSRYRQCQPEVEALVNQLPANTIVVSGGAIGVDTWAEQAAKRRGMQVMVFKPDKQVLKQAQNKLEVVQEYFRRNQEIVDHADEVYAFPHPEANGKGGTYDTIRKAQAAGIPVHII